MRKKFKARAFSGKKSQDLKLIARQRFLKLAQGPLAWRFC